MSTVRAGIFEGRYDDVYGHTGTIRVTVGADGLAESARMELQVTDEEEPWSIPGLVHLDANDPRLASAEAKPSAASLGSVLATVSSAGSFARQGIYGVMPANPEVGLGGGVWIAWQFSSLDDGGQP